MIINTLNIFPTLILTLDEFISEAQCKDIVKYIDLNIDCEEHVTFVGDAKSTHKKGNYSNDIIDAITNIPSCNDFKNKLDNAISSYRDHSGLQIKNIYNSWVNRQSKGSILLEHTHPQSVISGALYLNVDQNSSPLYFHNPNNLVFFQEIEKDTESNYYWYRVFPKNGFLVLFPSWLRHGSNNQINKSNDRIVLSFNTI